MSGGAWALAGDIAPPSLGASIGAVQNFGGYFDGALSPVVAELIVDKTGSYLLTFISDEIIAGCAAICNWFIVKKPISEKGGVSA
jgi:hypothetical protein